jgi:hypothetical protein
MTVGPRRKWLAHVVAGAVMATVMVPTLAQPAIACASFHGAVYFRDLAGGPPINDVPTVFYAAAEGSVAPARVSPMPGCGDVGQGGTFRAVYQTNEGTASSADFTPIPPGTTSEPMCDDIDSWEQWCGGVPRWRDVPIPTTADGTQDSLAVETFQIQLTDGIDAGVSTTHQNPVPVYIVDADGPPRSTLEPGAGSTVFEHVEAGRIRMPVFLAGPSPTSVGFSVAPEGPTGAAPGEDFTCTPDCPGGNGSLSVGPARFGFIQINFVKDDRAEPNERIRLTLTSRSPVEETSTVIEIIDLSNDRSAPVSRFHHPKQGLKYTRGDYRIREMHTFTGDVGVAGVDRVQIALRMKKDGGACGWWRGARFRSGECEDMRWLPMKYDATGELYFYRIKALKSTVGTAIKNYTAWTRATDHAGNVESSFQRGRNLSTFKVRRR